MKNHNTVVYLLDAGCDPCESSAINLCSKLASVGHKVIALDVMKPIAEGWRNFLRTRPGQDAERALGAARREKISTALQRTNLDWTVSVLHGIPAIEVARFARDVRASLVIKARSEAPELGTGALVVAFAGYQFWLFTSTAVIKP